MNWNLHDLVYEALSEEWGRRDGEISELGTKRERTGDVAKMCLLFDQGGDSN